MVNAVPGTRVLSAMTRSYFREPDLYRKRPTVADKHGFLLERVVQRLQGDPGEVVSVPTTQAGPLLQTLIVVSIPLGVSFLTKAVSA